MIECSRCTRLLLELNDFAEATNFSASSAENTDAEWARFEKKRLAEAQPASRSAATQYKYEPETRKNFFGFLSFKFAAAAFGVLAIVAFSAIFLTTRNREIGETSIALQMPPAVKKETAAPLKTPADEKEITAVNTNLSGNYTVPAVNRRNPNSSSSLQPKTKNKIEGANVNRPPIVPKINRTPALSDEAAFNTADFSLYPTEVLRGASDEMRKILVKKMSAGQIRLKLNAPKAEKSSGFSIVITDSQNKSVLTLPIMPDKHGDFYIVIPAKKLPADVYSLKIYVEENNAEKLFTEYDFRLDYE